MPVTIREGADADWPIIANFTLQAFADDQFNQIIYPWRDSPEGLKIAEENMRGWHNSDARNRHMVAVDGESGETAAVAIWTLYDEDPYLTDAENKGVNAFQEAKWLEQWKDPQNKQYGELVMNGFRDHRKQLTESHGPHCHLSFLATDPKFYRKGAGSALIKWGTNLADEKGWPCTVEASPYATERRVYHKFGFEEVKKLVFEDRERFPDWYYWNMLMVRPARKTA